MHKCVAKRTNITTIIHVVFLWPHLLLLDSTIELSLLICDAFLHVYIPQQ